MIDSNFAELWEDADYSLHKLQHILKGLACVSEDADPINETINTLIHIALDQVEDSRKRLFELHGHQCAQENEAEE